MSDRATLPEPIVITGIGLVTALGQDRESTWEAVQAGRSRFRFLREIFTSVPESIVGATIDVPSDGRLRVLPVCERAVSEAMDDARIDFGQIERNRFGCMVSGHMADVSYVDELMGKASAPSDFPWWRQCFPDTACRLIAQQYDLRGPRACHFTACASSLISVLSATRALRDHQCDIALAGGGEMIHPLIVAGFNQMRVLATDEDPNRACRPFDANRSGFVFGEGAAFFILERFGHAMRRGAKIYAEIRAAQAVAQAHHVTGLDAESRSLEYLIGRTLERAELAPSDIGYINAHGTGTQQNDEAEARAIRRAFGGDADHICVSATKSILGHMINAAGAVELAVTALALRDGFVPPTLNLEHPDPACPLDCVPLRGRPGRIQHALKLSLAFGGHLVAVALSRWNDAKTGFRYPSVRRAA